MKLKIEIELDNAAFDGRNKGPEAARILERTAKQLRENGNLKGYAGCKLRDENGNTVGFVDIEL